MFACHIDVRVNKQTTARTLAHAQAAMPANAKCTEYAANWKILKPNKVAVGRTKPAAAQQSVSAKNAHILRMSANDMHQFDVDISDTFMDLGTLWPHFTRPPDNAFRS